MNPPDDIGRAYDDGQAQFFRPLRRLAIDGKLAHTHSKPVEGIYGCGTIIVVAGDDDARQALQ
ncbi:MAG: hypothetical protein PVSMB5_24880 [Ktedonobacteraceae bacterium]